jgi:putative ABC transport system permease protein
VSARDDRRRPTSASSRRGAIRRSLLGGTALLVRRRTRRDAPLLLGWTALLCLASLLAVAVPALALDSVDSGSRAAVAEAGSPADLVLRVQVGDPDASPGVATPAELGAIAGELPDNLPVGLARVAGDPAVSELSPDIPLARTQPDGDAARISARFGLLGADQRAGLTLLDGRLPAAGSDSEIEVLLSEAAADSGSLPIGTALTASAPAAAPDESSTTVTVRVVGIAASAPSSPAARCAPEWCDLPTMWAPGVDTSRLSGETAEVTLLAADEGVELARTLFLDPFTASVRLPLRAERFTGELVTTVVAEMDALQADPGGVAPTTGATVEVRSEFADALRGYGGRAAASVAQMTLVIAGLFGTAAAVLLLLGGLLVRRRSSDLALERARGASLASVAVRGLAESLVLAAVGTGSGLAIAALLLPGPIVDPLPLAAVCAIAVLAPPAQALLVSREAWRGRRQAANRRDRQRLAGRARSRRIVLELLVVVLAVAAIASLRSRGLVQARTDGTDLLLAAAPLLLGVAVSLVVVRLNPLAVRAAAALATHSRGASGLLASAHARRSVAALPLLALTIAVALVVGGSLIVQTVRQGQADASWQQVGADARVEGVDAAAVVDGVRRASGVTAASAQLVLVGASVDSGAASASVSVLAFDAGFPGLAHRLPPGTTPAPEAFDALITARTSAEELPVLIDARLAARVDTSQLALTFDQTSIPVRVVGTVDGGPDAYLDGPVVYAQQDALAEVFDELPRAGTLLVIGDGAATAARSLDGAAEVVTREKWLADLREQPLVHGVDRMARLSVAAVALLAAIALAATVAAGGRSRSRSLSLLRTLGVQRGFGWALALAELVPLLFAALVGGTAAGVGIVAAAGPALGLRLLTGATGEPGLRVDPVSIVLVVAGGLVLCAIAIAVDVVAHRRDRPGDVLRVGETT